MVNYYADGSLLCNGRAHCFAMEGLIALQWNDSASLGAWLIEEDSVE